MASSAPTNALRRLLDEHVSSVSTEVEGLVAEARQRTRRELIEQLNGAARRMRQAADSEELVATLVDAASGFAPGAAFLRVEDKTARGERIRGVPDESSDRFVGMQIALEGAPALAGAVETKDPVTAVATAGEVSAELLEIAVGSADARVEIVPVLVRGTVRGLLYCWGNAPLAAVELLCEIAAAVWSGIEPITVTPPPAQIVTIAGVEEKRRPTWESLPADEQQIHLRAQRTARVEVAELRLQDAAAVHAGRTRRDLYGALRLKIDEARARFRDTYFVRCPSMVDYLHLELVRTLANGDAESLGREYPGPLV
jgi:hypothetical protein